MTARRWWAWPLVPLYAIGLAVKDGLRQKGMLRTRRLRWPVVSVGSLSAGGAGKTPVVIALADLLRARRWDVDVLSRGYGRSGEGVKRVDAEATDAARRFGDEPVLIALRAGLAVWVGAERFWAGKAAEAAGVGSAGVGQRKADSSAALRDDVQMRVHLLDDGFQHRGLARAVDVVVVTASDFEDALLPAGNRRERMAALGRADVVVLREEERERIEARARGLMSPGAAMWCVRRELEFTSEECERAKQRRVVGFCAIARPEGFWAMLAGAGCEVVERVAFGDHHRYEAVDVERLVRVAKGCEAEGFVTTEKDAVKLSEAMLERLRAVGAVCVAGLEAKFVDEARVLRDLEARLR